VFAREDRNLQRFIRTCLLYVAPLDLELLCSVVIFTDVKTLTSRMKTLKASFLWKIRRPVRAIE